MIADSAPRSATNGRAMAGALFRAPFAAEGWLATAHVVVGFPMGLLTLAVTAVLGLLSLGLAVTVVPAAAFLTVLLHCNRAFTGWQRSRFAAFLGVDIPPPEAVETADGWFSRLSAQIRHPSVRHHLGYHLLAGLLGTAGFLAVVAAWSGGLTLATALVHRWGAEGDTMLGDPVALLLSTAAGVVLFFGAPWIARGVAALDRSMALALLGRSRADQLAERVESLESSRAGVVDAADAERRRIERDLHDGTQQRLTALAMNLGVARQTLIDVPDPARETITRAHEDVKEALAELRNFVRGLHPAVLDDRGLDAALSGIVARAPVPVALDCDVAQRPSSTVEAVAYFVVSEALTNIAKHAQASHAEVTARSADGRLRLTVRDDGRGGADRDHGTGLRGLQQRVASVDGVLHLHSPVGGGTTITVELPCES